MKDFFMIWFISFLAVAIVITALIPNANIWIVIVVVALILAMLCYWILKLYERLEALEKEESPGCGSGRTQESKTPQGPESGKHTE